MHYASDDDISSTELVIEIIELLIGAGADVGAKNEEGKTPLHFAARLNLIEIAELLIEKGADLEAEDKGGETPLDRAQSDEMRELLKKYMKK